MYDGGEPETAKAIYGKIVDRLTAGEPIHVSSAVNLHGLHMQAAIQSAVFFAAHPRGGIQIVGPRVDDPLGRGSAQSPYVPVRLHVLLLHGEVHVMGAEYVLTERANEEHAA